MTQRLRMLPLALLLAALAAPTAPAAPAAPDTVVFAHGVSSGDPLPWAVVIWTRVTPVPEATPGSGIGAPTELRWEVATDAAFHSIVRSGMVTAIATYDHTAAVDVWGLIPNTEYYYRYWYGTSCSRVGRTRTAPCWFAWVSSVRFGLVSCSNWEGGYFAGYRHLAERDDLDFILHVGDYIYEYEVGGYGPGPEIGRFHDPEHEIVTLEDYRRRYAQYRTDPDLQDLHARYPWICVWDDHEVADDAWSGGAVNHTPGEEGPFVRRLGAAYQAYFEWIPLRRPNPWFDPTRIYRRFVFGDLVDLAVLDLRQYRTEQAAFYDLPALNDPARTMMGFTQLGWAGNALLRTTRRWRLLANSVMFVPWQIPINVPNRTQQAMSTMKTTTVGAIPVYNDLWVGFAGEQKRIVEFLKLTRIPNVVFLTGDIHSTFAADIPADPFTYHQNPRSVAVEFVGPSITSANINEILEEPPRTALSLAAELGTRIINPYIKDVELDSHGYVVIDVTPFRIQGDTWHLSDPTDPDATIHFYRGWQCFSGTSRMQPVVGPVGPR